MERNRWETALRCLEIAVHPNTSDKEIVAAVNGFRRTAGGTPLTRLYREFAELEAIGAGRGGKAWHLLDRLDQLHQENRRLQRRIAEAEASRAAALRQLQDAERRNREALVAAEQRADLADRQLAEFRGAYGRISGGLQTENRDLRRALDEARRNLAQPIHAPIAPFRDALDAALQRPGRQAAQAVPAANPSWTA